MDDAATKVRSWARRCNLVASQPISPQAQEGIRVGLISAALRRMEAGTTTKGQPMVPLSPRYAAQKQRSRGQRKFWQLSGESRRRIGGRCTGKSIITTINTSYSGFVHDGATWTPKPHRAKPMSAKQQKHLSKLHKVARKARDQRLMAAYGRKTAATARRDHEVGKREAKAYQHTMRAVIARKLVAETKARFARKRSHGEVSVGAKRIVLPARPVLGVSDADKVWVGKVLARDAASRLGGS